MCLNHLMWDQSVALSNHEHLISIMSRMRQPLRRISWWVMAYLLMIATGVARLEAAVVYERTSAHHHIQVIDNNGIRTLSFNGSQETRMSLRYPLQGHFVYTEYFHMPWLWNNQITDVLMMGLGGGSIQRAYQYYYPDVKIDTVELDPVVVDVARQYFSVKPSATHRIIRSDGRLYLRRTKKNYDLILMDAYTSNRYGSFIPYPLVTKEFFQMASERLTDDGVIAYNVIGTLQGWRADILGAVYKTMKSVFPNVYLFPAPDSLNVVLVGTKSDETVTTPVVRQRAAELVKDKRVTIRSFGSRVNAIRFNAPRAAARSPVLIDDFAPVDGLLTKAK